MGRVSGEAGKWGALSGIVVLLMLGCAGPRQNVGSAPVEAGEFNLVLNNHHLLDVNIFVQHDGQADRVTTVPASSTKMIVLPAWMLGQSKVIRLIAEPIGDDTRYTTEFLSLRPGGTVELNVESSIARSNYNIQ